MKLLVCGGRNFKCDYSVFAKAIDCLPEKPQLIIHGGMRGADEFAEAWARENRVHCAVIGAFGDKDLQKRNSVALGLKPSACLITPGGDGTADMVSQCRAAGVPIIFFKKMLSF